MSNLVTVIDDVYYSDDVMTMIRSNKEYLIHLSSPFEITQLNIVQANRYDFGRVLRQLGVPTKMHWIIAYINGLEDPNADIQGMTSFLDVDPGVIDNMITRMNTIRI